MQANIGTRQSSRFTKRRSVRYGGAFLALALMAGLLAACELAPAPGTSNSPSGYVDVVTGGADSVRVQGWTSDWNTRNPIDVVVMINGVWAPGVFTANLPRTDVAARYGRGANFGYDVTLPAPAGALSVCVVALNVGRGENTVLGCNTTTATSPTTPTTTTTTSTTTTSLVPVVRPTIGSADPAYGTTAGGTTVELLGQNLLGTTSVKFDGVEATSFRIDGPRSVFAVVPPRASAGPVDVTLTTPGGTSDPVEFTYIDCSSANWVPDADLRGCNLSELDLRDLDLQRADLTGANLERSALANSIFEFADLTDAVLTNAIIQNTNFIDAIMVGATLTDTVIVSARMQAANLRQANLTGSDLTNAVFDFNTIWSDTICPNGTVQSTECSPTP